MKKIELLEDERLIKVAMGYDPVLKDRVKALPRARWNAEKKYWTVPVEAAGDLLDTIAGSGFEIDPRVEELSQGARSSLARQLRRKAEAEAWTPSRINQKVQETLQQNFSEDIWVIAQISGWNPAKIQKEVQNRSAVYFDLVERYEGQTDYRARISAVVYSEGMERIRAVASKAGVVLQDGIQVKLLGRLKSSIRGGNLNFDVKDMDPEYNMVQANRKREEILKKLDEQGIAEQNRRLDWPLVPLRIGLITSDGSMACGDFLTRLHQSGYAFEVRVYDARMQGEDLEKTVIAGLTYFRNLRDQVDVVVIVRGGGARTDLEWFDSYNLGEAICLYPLPVLCGIGHTDDVCLIDYIAHKSLPVPTSVAAFLVEQVENYLGTVEFTAQNIARQAEAIRMSAQHQWDTLSRSIISLLTLKLQRTTHQLNSVQTQLRTLSSQSVREIRLRLDQRQSTLNETLSRIPEQEIRRLTALEQRLSPHALLSDLHHQNQQLTALHHRLSHLSESRLQGLSDVLIQKQQALQIRTEQQLKQLGQDLELISVKVNLQSPERVLEKGYAIVRGPDHQIVRSVSQLTPGQLLLIRLAEGRVEVQVQTGVSPEPAFPETAASPSSRKRKKP